MKTKRLIIRNPCNEKWAEMTPQEKGRHCAKCDKVVIDLTAEDARIAFQRVAESEAKLCVRILPHHLDYVHREYAEQSRRDFSLKAIAMGAALISAASLSACSEKSPTVSREVPSGHVPQEKAPVPVAEKVEVEKIKPVAAVYTVSVKDDVAHNGVRDAAVKVFHGKKVDLFQTDRKGCCTFSVDEKTFRIEVYHSDYVPLELTDRSFHAGKANAMMLYAPIMGEPAISTE